jgi:hypothetical protein
VKQPISGSKSAAGGLYWNAPGYLLALRNTAMVYFNDFNNKTADYDSTNDFNSAQIGAGGTVSIPAGSGSTLQQTSGGAANKGPYTQWGVTGAQYPALIVAGQVFIFESRSEIDVVNNAAQFTGFSTASAPPLQATGVMATNIQYAGFLISGTTSIPAPVYRGAAGVVTIPLLSGATALAALVASTSVNFGVRISGPRRFDWFVNDKRVASLVPASNNGLSGANGNVVPTTANVTLNAAATIFSHDYWSSVIMPRQAG